MNKVSSVLDVARRRAREGHLGLWRQMGEMAALRALYGIGPNYYQLAGFWRRELRWGAKTGQLAEREYQRRIARLNPQAYRKLSHNKIAEKAILSLFGIPTPRFLGRLHARLGYDTAGRPLRNAADLERLARELGASRLVFKPAEGMRGEGVRIPSIERQGRIRLRDLDGDGARSVEAYCAETLELRNGGDFVLEEYFRQHAVLASLNPGSVNTIRVWVIDRVQARHHVLLAFLRIGRGAKCVDNLHSGGIAAPIDVDTGRLGAAREAEPDFNLYPCHPDHGAPIEGVRLPCWPQVAGMATRALAVFPRLHFAGLDVAIGPAGPAVLELNLHAERAAAAIADCASRDVLKP